MSDIIIHDNSPRFMEDFEKRVDAALEAVGIFLEGEAKTLCNRPYEHKTPPSPRPYIDTGLLRNSITHAISNEKADISSYSGDNPSRYSDKGGIPKGYYRGKAPNDPKEKKAVYIGTNVEYAVYVHEGSANIKTPNRFLKDAITLNQKQVREYIVNKLKGD